MFRPRSIFASCSIVGGCIWMLAPLALAVTPFRRVIKYEYFLLVAPMLLFLGVIGTYRTYAPRYSLAGQGGICLLGAGVLGLIPLGTHNTLYVYSLGPGILLLLTALIGAILIELGTIGIAIDAWQTGVPSRRLALWLPLALPATAATNHIGTTVLGIYPLGMHYYSGISGLMWIGLGYFLWQSPDGN